MKSRRKIAGILLLVVGVLSLAFGGFTYTKDTDTVDVGPIHIEAKDKERVNIPVWAGAGAVVAGVVLLVL
jgi:drug/metabolite transporter (DMT)-like permease